MSSIRVLVAEEHALLRAGLCAVLRSLGGVEIAGEADDGETALAMVEGRRPDLVLVDVALPGINGHDFCSRLIQQFPGVRSIILSMYVEEAHVREAVRVGAEGYLLKDAVPAEIELAVRSVARGYNYMSPPVLARVLAVYKRYARGEAPPLSPRQQEVLRLMAEGQNTREIAATLGVSVKTVETHRAQVMERLGINDVAGLVRYAIRIGLIKPDA